MCAAKSDVRFTPNSDRESGLRQTVMSALPPKADMCSAMSNVSYGPEADIPLARNALRLSQAPGQIPEKLSYKVGFFSYSEKLTQSSSHDVDRQIGAVSKVVIVRRRRYTHVCKICPDH
jgi:hypothetical protein